MKKTYKTPKLSVYGSIQQITEKTAGSDDGTFLTINGIGAGAIGDGSL